MGVARAGNLETVGQSNAQFSGGSLRFDSTKSHYLSRTPASASNRKTWTWAGWVKLCAVPGTYTVLFGAGAGGSDSGLIRLNYESSGKLNLAAWNTDPIIRTAAVYRDFSAWYHIVVAVDTANATASNRAKIYINGTEAAYDSDFRSSISNLDTPWNSNVFHAIGRLTSSDGQYANAYFANVYNIDGQALDASYFGYTDPLTNTWRPKKYTGTFGTNGFYLPLDGNTPIGQDQSGRGNNWTPVNFGGSNTLEKATGAFPILNTDGGGKVARVGVRTDSNSSSLVLALPLVGNANDVSNAINGGTSAKTVTVSSATVNNAYSNFYGGSYYFSSASLSIASNADLSFGTGDFTVEYWAYYTSAGPTVVVGATNGLWIGQNGSNFVLRAYGVADLVSYAGSPPTNKWVHIAVTRQGTTARIFFDGIQVASGTTSQNFIQSTLYIGSDGAGSFSTVYIQDLRIYKGLAKYTQHHIQH